jgi:hypothetical protein
VRWGSRAEFKAGRTGPTDSLEKSHTHIKFWRPKRRFTVAEIESFQGFFSYARHDADTDPKLVEALTKRLEKRVSGKLTNARFSIWQDVCNLRTGDRWDDRIDDAVRASHVFIILLTPKWYESPYCRKEYQIFQGVEVDFEVGEYVVPLLARPIDRQVENFDQAQKDVYDSLKIDSTRIRLLQSSSLSRRTNGRLSLTRSPMISTRLLQPSLFRY